MNGKQARRLRKLAGEGTSVFKEHNDSVWGPLPKVKGENRKAQEWLVDGKALNKALNKITNAKFKGQGFTALLRWSPGIPRKLDECPRKIYKQLKKEFVSG